MSAPPSIAFEDATADCAPWTDERLESEPVKSRTASEPFQQLLHQLLQQHLREVSLATRRVPPGESRCEVKGKPKSVQSAMQYMSSRSGDRSDAGSSDMGREKRPTGISRGASVGNLKRAASKISDAGPHVAVRKTTILDALGQNRRSKRAQDQEKASWLYDTERTGEDDEEVEELTLLQKWQRRMLSWKYEMLIAVALCLNVIWMAVELQVAGGRTGYDVHVYLQQISDKDWPAWQSAFLIGNLLFTSFFFLDVVLRICVLRTIFWKTWMNYVDLAVALLTIMEAFAFFSAELPVDPIFLRIIRMGKLARATRLVTLNSVLSSLELLIKYLIASTHMLFWSFCLLTFIQCVAGILASTLCLEFMNNQENDESIRREVFLYYGTFTRTFLTMFEVLFANWGPPCRVLVENISEWFCVFFLIYRCVLGFAILNVVNAVFVQQTIKTASSDEELAYKQKERDIAMYTRKVKNLFFTLDTSGDGSIDQEEFSKLVKHPMLKFWMSQLELEYHDLLSLFEYLDNGDGEITLIEFIEGATRLRGSAKALDIWRMESKVEMLFEHLVEVLKEHAVL
eukprot:Skav202946  [mRNA]  locus=scaffold422:437215:438924:+ [translate_table: standard]